MKNESDIIFLTTFKVNSMNVSLFKFKYETGRDVSARDEVMHHTP